MVSVQLTAFVRAPGLFPAAGEPNAPYTPGRWPIGPPTQVHSLVEGLYSHRSPKVPPPYVPSPPKSHKLPLLSVQRPAAYASRRVISATAQRSLASEWRVASCWLSTRRVMCVGQMTGVTSSSPCTRYFVRHISPGIARQVEQ